MIWKLLEKLVHTLTNLVQAHGYSMYSARHTLWLITRMYGEFTADRQEIGWCPMSTSQDPALRPLQSIVKRHNITSVVVPDRYTQTVSAHTVFNVMERQVTVMCQHKQTYKIYLGTRRGKVFKTITSEEEDHPFSTYLENNYSVG